MKILKKTMTTMAVASFAFIGLSACEKKSPAEEAAEDIGDGIEEAGDAIKDAVN